MCPLRPLFEIMVSRVGIGVLSLMLLIFTIRQEMSRGALY